MYDPNFCAFPTKPVIHNKSQGTGKMVWRKVEVIIGQNTSVDIMMSTWMTILKNTDMVMTRALDIRITQRGAVFKSIVFIQ